MSICIEQPKITLSCWLVQAYLACLESLDGPEGDGHTNEQRNKQEWTENPPFLQGFIPYLSHCPRKKTVTRGHSFVRCFLALLGCLGEIVVYAG